MRHQNAVTDLESVKALLVASLDRLVADLFGSVVKSTRNEFRLGSIDGELGESLKITRTGHYAGLWHDFNPAGSGSGDVITLIERRRNLNFKEAVKWARDWLGVSAGDVIKKPPDSSEKERSSRLREANSEFLARRQKRLRESPEVLRWLKGRGLYSETAQAFHLDLSEIYTDREGVDHGFALTAPVIGPYRRPLNSTVYHNIPGLTLNPTDINSWMKGPPRTYYSEAADRFKTVFVCEGLKDLWRTWQALSDNQEGITLLLISSTHGSGIPDEWQNAAFWSRFESIFLGQDNDRAGDALALRVARVAGHETLRVRPPREKGKDWTDFWQQGGSLVEFHALLAEAMVMGEDLASGGEADSTLGRYGYKPVDITTAFHRGHLYYPVRTLINDLEETRDKEGKIVKIPVSRIETVVVRSDRTVHTVREDPAPKGTPPEDRVLRLTDGTLIESRPKASLYSTWSWASISAYRESRTKLRPLIEILADIDTHLRQSIWLPYEEDYAVLTLLVPVTFAQAVFQSVPMILVVGPPGSGKSALGRAMARVCANAAAVGQVSAAGVARLIHETKGFVVMDDLESIGYRSGKDAPQFNELIQALKLSYNKETSWKIWTDVSRGMRVERLNFFGVKMINNTIGTDNILGSRMLRVQTRKIPEELKASLGVFDQMDAVYLDRLRDELHTWTFENVALLDATYKRLFPKPTDRATEIAAPLRVFADIAQDDSLACSLTRALDNNRRSIADPDDPIETMKEAMKRLVREGYQEISTTHVVMEMKTLTDPNADRHLTNEIAKWEDPAWVGRQLRTHDIISTNAQGARQWLFGKSLRIYPIKEHFIVEVLQEHGEENREYMIRSPTDFCAGCAHCRYRSVSCPIMDNRLSSEKKLCKRNGLEDRGH